jgi:hypothetical protein
MYVLILFSGSSTINHIAGCGPASLNILVRKIVANEIRRKRDNKSQGPITLISEEYEY